MAHRIIRTPVFVLLLLGTIVAIHMVAGFGGYYAAESEPNAFRVDWLLHGMTGFWIAAIFFFETARRYQGLDLRKYPLFALVVSMGTAALLGVLWELFEFYLDFQFGGTLHYIRQQPSLADTMFDFLFDIGGAAACGILYLWPFKK